jgi:hypothetical protein
VSSKLDATGVCTVTAPTRGPSRGSRAEPLDALERLAPVPAGSSGSKPLPSEATGRSSRIRPTVMRHQGVCLTFPETHLPNALDLFAFVPYLALKAAGSGLRSAQHALAALVVACC